ncbi:MAG: sensor histidine kinase [bacterium]
MQTFTHNTTKNLLLGFGIWSAYNFLNAGILSIQEKLPYINAWSSTATVNYTMALVSIPLWFLCNKFPFRRSKILPFFGFHLVSAVLFAALSISIAFSIYWLVFGEFLVKILLSRGIHMWQFLDGLTKYGLLVGIFYTVSFYKKFKEKELKETELNLLAKNMELQNLKSQINPHFLFNALNSVNALITKSPEKARTMNAKLAQLLRLSLDGYDQKFVTLEQELQFIRNYLDIEKIRFGKKLQVDEQIDDSALDARIPSMLLQPLVENAIKHGISQQARGGTLGLHIRKANKYLNFEIENSCKSPPQKALEKSPNKGIGLKNTVDRLKRLYGDACDLELNNNDCTFKVSFKIPYEKARI